jgi:hypothetical protein
MAAESVLTDRAIQIIADNKIRAAIEAGEFDNFPGFGKPIESIDDPYDPYWWIRQKLKREELRVDLLARGRSS